MSKQKMENLGKRTWDLRKAKPGSNQETWYTIDTQQAMAKKLGFFDDILGIAH